MPYVDGVYVSREKYMEAFPPRAVLLEQEEEEAEAAAPVVKTRGGPPVARPTNSKSVKRQRGTKAAALAATGVKLPDGIQLPEDGIVPPVSQTNAGGVVPNDESLDAQPGEE